MEKGCAKRTAKPGKEETAVGGRTRSADQAVSISGRFPNKNKGKERDRLELPVERRLLRLRVLLGTESHA